MSIDLPYEIKLAQRVINRYKLIPPVNIFDIANRWANVEIEVIPLEVDAACFDLKSRGKQPTIILNKNRPERRVRFTLAHELGHVLIPWHRGDFIEDTSPETTAAISWKEAEANRFASELLLPSDWVAEMAKGCEDPTKLVFDVSEIAKVSTAAAAFKVNRFLEPGYIFALLSPDFSVKSSDKSPGTFISRPSVGSLLKPESAFSRAEKYWKLDYIDGQFFCWWKIITSLSINQPVNGQDWRAILEEILHDLGEYGFDPKKVSASVNGTIGAVNNSRIHPVLSREQFAAGIFQRIWSKADNEPMYRRLLEHPKLADFLNARIISMYKDK